MTAIGLWVRLLLIQVLLLLITITIESWVLHRKQKWSQRTSVQYGTISNLFATAIGWLVFFSIEPFLSDQVQKLLTRFSLFDKELQEPILINHVMFVLIYLAIFLGNAIIKRIGLGLLQNLLSLPEAAVDRTIGPSPSKIYLSYKKQVQNRQQAGPVLPDLTGTVITATFLSQLTACLILILLINYLRIRAWVKP
ncbi:filament integrity protein FraC [Trichothermofontia sp.]